MNFLGIVLTILEGRNRYYLFQRGDSPPEQILQRRARMPVVAFPWRSLNTFPIEEPDSRRSSNCPALPLIGQRNWHANAHELETSLLCNAGKHHDKYKQKKNRPQSTMHQNATHRNTGQCLSNQSHSPLVKQIHGYIKPKLLVVIDNQTCYSHISGYQ